MKIVEYARESLPTQDALTQMALTQIQMIAPMRDAAIPSVHSKNVEATMVGDSKIELPIVKSFSASLKSCHPSMLFAFGYTKTTAFPALRLQKL